MFFDSNPALNISAPRVIMRQPVITPLLDNTMTKVRLYGPLYDRSWLWANESAPAIMAEAFIRWVGWWDWNPIQFSFSHQRSMQRHSRPNGRRFNRAHERLEC